LLNRPLLCDCVSKVPTQLESPHWVFASFFVPYSSQGTTLSARPAAKEVVLFLSWKCGLPLRRLASAATCPSLSPCALLQAAMEASWSYGHWYCISTHTRSLIRFRGLARWQPRATETSCTFLKVILAFIFRNQNPRFGKFDSRDCPSQARSSSGLADPAPREDLMRWT